MLDCTGTSSLYRCSVLCNDSRRVLPVRALLVARRKFVAQYLLMIMQSARTAFAGHQFCQRIGPNLLLQSSGPSHSTFRLSCCGGRPETPGQVLHVLLRPPASVVSLRDCHRSSHARGRHWVSASRTLPGPIVLSNPHHAVPYGLLGCAGSCRIGVAARCGISSPEIMLLIINRRGALARVTPAPA